MLAAVAVMIAASCSSYETYAEQKDKERDAIQRFISDSTITVISEAQFKENGYATDVEKNEYVLFEGTGIYMQVISRGCGDVLPNGTNTVLVRFTEKNIMTDSITCSNNSIYYATVPEKISVVRTNASFTATFDATSSVMNSVYGSTSVPSGWLVPLTYLKIGRPVSDDEDIARIKLIVPHSEGTSYASQVVAPYYYELTYQLGR